MVDMRRTQPGRTAATEQRAVIYCRVSKDDSESGRSVDEQLDECQEDAERIGATVVRVFDDKDISASRHSRKRRPDYEDLIEFLKSGTVNVLILWASSRGDRDLTRWSTLLDLCRKLDIKIRVYRDRRTYDLSIPRDWETLASDGVKNAAYVEELRDAVMRALSANVEDGKPHGYAPFGYDREYVEIRRKLVPVRQFIVEEKADIVREAYKRFKLGETLSSIARDFNKRHLPSPAGKGWNIVNLGRVLKNPAYMGKRSHYGTLTKATWPAIVDEADWQTCVDMLNNPDRRTNRNTEVQHLLSGIMTCGVCNSPVKAHSSNGHPVYMCKTKFCASVPRSEADDYVNQQVREHLITVTLNPTQGDSERAEAQRKAEELQVRLDEIEEEMKDAKGRSVVRLNRAADALEAEIEELLRQARTVRTAPIVGFLISNPEKWDDLTITQKREYIRTGTLIDSIEVMPHGKSFTRKPIEQRVEIHWVETRLSSNPNS